MPTPNALSVSQLDHFVGTPACPVIIDVRVPEDFDDDPRMIAGAVKRDFDRVDALIEEFLGKKVVIYCQKGLKISQGTAALLRQKGIKAKFLKGGQFAWRETCFPMIAVSSIPRDKNESQTLFVTHHAAKISGMACSWLIKRFVDPKAELLFVEPSQVMNVADRFNATPFDIEGVKFSSQGEASSFARMLEEFGLVSSEPLDTLAKIVRGTSNNRHDLAKEVAGLSAFSIGLSHMYSDDLERLEAGMLICDALYRWAREGRRENHVLASAHDVADLF